MRIEPVHFWMAGVEFRPNICTEIGDIIEYHAHDFSHVTQVLAGRWLELVTGEELASFAFNKNGLLRRRIEILAGKQHAFKLLELENNIGCLECLWAGGVK